MIAWWLGAALAAPGFVSVQGSLTNGDGLPVDGAQPITFRLKPAGGGAAVHTETQTVVFSGGAFSVALGTNQALDLDVFRAPAGLAFTLELANGGESGPVTLSHVPLAARASSAANADDAARLGGSLPEDFRRTGVNIPWTELANRPAGLDDGDTFYAPTGAGLTLTGTDFAVDHAALTPSWANVQGRPTPTATGQFLRASAPGTWTPATLSAGDLPALTGDVTGSAGVTVVGSIQGRPIAATAPSSGQVLAWNGSAWAPANQTGGVELTGAQSIAGVKTFTTGVTVAPTAALVIPNGATRPASPASGTLFYNSATTALEYYDGASWKQFFATSGELAGLKVYFDAANSGSNPGSGTTWYDISGNNANGTMVGGVTRSSLGGIATMVLDGTSGSVQFPNGGLNTQRMTAVLWVYSQHAPTGDFNQGGLYSNRTDNSPNAADYVWFGRYAVNIWYFRVNNNSCCTDLTGSGNTSFDALVPQNTWKMVHFAYEAGGQWKWGADGASSYSAAFPGRPNSQTMPTSAIGIGHNSSGSWWKGGVASARFYDRMLSEAELAAEFARLRSRYGR